MRLRDFAAGQHGSHEGLLVLLLLPLLGSLWFLVEAQQTCGEVAFRSKLLPGLMSVWFGQWWFCLFAASSLLFRDDQSIVLVQRV